MGRPSRPFFCVVPHRAKIPVLDLKDGHSNAGMQQHFVGSETVEVGLNVDPPFSRELLVEKTDHLALAI